jgi:uncharacterized RDD family membrane protein YckC
MTENPPPPSGTPEGGGSTPPPPQNPYGSPSDQPSAPPPPPQNPYGSQPPPPAEPYAGNPPSAGQTPYGAPPPPAGQSPYGASSYPVAPGGPAPVAGVQPGGLGGRFLARLIDGVILIIPNVVLLLIFDNVIAGILGGVMYIAYYVYLESSRGRTFGKQILGMRVHGAAGGNPTTEESLRRNSWAALSIISYVPILGWIASVAELAAIIAIAVTISTDPLNRGWHDKFGNTSVTKEG